MDHRKNRKYHQKTRLQQMYKLCRMCNKVLPISKFEKFRSGTYRCVCNQCRWEMTIKPSAVKSFVRRLEERH